MLVKEAKAIIGSLGKPSKMPGFSYGLPACEAKWVPEFCRNLNLPIPPHYGCDFGSLLAKNPNSPCHNCYADNRGNYTYESLKHGQLLRLIGTYHSLWKDAMIMLIDRYIDPSEPYFRWLDSGDLPHKKMLHDIVEIANALPHVKFWLPTQERRLVSKFLRYNKKPDNLCIRISNVRKDSHAPESTTTFKFFAKNVITSSSISTENKHDCPSDQYDNTCGPCRKCWDTGNEHTIYKLH